VKLTTLIFCGLLLGACSQSDSDRTREEAHQTAEQAKHDSEVALKKAEVDANKASRELNKDLDKAREKVRGALDEHEHPADSRDTH
jgi:hypothetical protein